MRTDFEIPARTFRRLLVEVPDLPNQIEAAQFDEERLRRNPEWLGFFRRPTSIELADIIGQGLRLRSDFQLFMMVTWYEPGQVLRGVAIVPAEAITNDDEGMVPICFRGFAKGIFDGNRKMSGSEFFSHENS
jgi:hypothetical protein